MANGFAYCHWCAKHVEIQGAKEKQFTDKRGVKVVTYGLCSCGARVSAITGRIDNVQQRQRAY